MTHCLEFWRKWEKEPNFCGLGRSAVQLYNSYLKLVKELSEQGIDESVTIVTFPEGIARPVHTLSGDLRARTVKIIVDGLKTGKKFTAQDVKDLLGIKKKESYCGTPQPGDFKSAEPVPEAQPLSQTGGFAVRAESEVTGEVPSEVPQPAPIMSHDPVKQKQSERDYHATELLKRMPESTRLMVSDLLRENKSWKVADAFYFGIQALAERKGKR